MSSSDKKIQESSKAEGEEIDAALQEAQKQGLPPNWKLVIDVSFLTLLSYFIKKKEKETAHIICDFVSLMKTTTRVLSYSIIEMYYSKNPNPLLYLPHTNHFAYHDRIKNEKNG